MVVLSGAISSCRDVCRARRLCLRRIRSYQCLVNGIRRLTGTRMSDGQREGVSTSLQQLHADAADQPVEAVSELQTVEEGDAEEVYNKDPGEDIEDEEIEQLDSDDDPLFQQLEEELEQATFWESNFAQQQERRGTESNRQTTQQTYRSRIAYLS